MASSDKYYHHTSEEAAKKIIQSGVIKKSDPKNGDAAYGPGTYVTKVGPDASQSKVAQNNYDGATKHWESQIKSGKTDVTIEMKLPADKVRKCPTTDGRDVHVYKGDLPLSKAKDVKVHVRGQTYSHQ